MFFFFRFLYPLHVALRLEKKVPSTSPPASQIRKREGDRGGGIFTGHMVGRGGALCEISGYSLVY